MVTSQKLNGIDNRICPQIICVNERVRMNTETSVKMEPWSRFCGSVINTSSIRMGLYRSPLVGRSSDFLSSRISRVCFNSYQLTFWRRIFFFLNFSTPVFKMWVIQKPNKVALWNKRHFQEKKWRLYSMFKIFSMDICWINIKWGI